MSKPPPRQHKGRSPLAPEPFDMADARRTNPRWTIPLLILLFFVSAYYALTILPGPRETKLSGDPCEWRWVQAQDEWKSGKRQAAIRILEAAMSECVHIPGITYQLADYYLQTERYADAESLYRLLRKRNPKDYEVQLALVTIYEARGDREQALAQAEALTQLRPKDPRGWIHWSGLLAAQDRREQTVEVLYRGWREVPASRKLTRLLEAALRSRIEERIAVPDWEAVHTAVQRLLEIAPDDAAMLFIAGQSALALMREQEARRYFYRACRGGNAMACDKIDNMNPRQPDSRQQGVEPRR